MEIRTFNPDDQQAVIALWQDCDLLVHWNNPAQDIERKLAVDPDLFLVGCVGGEIIASVMGGYDGHRGWVNYLAVAPGSHRTGYGRRIMSAVEELLLARGCPKVNLQVRNSNTSVISFYESLGYTVDEVVGMGKRIAPPDQSF